MFPLLCSLALAGSTGGASVTADALPDWSDARTRGDAQVSVVEGLLAAGMPEKALTVLSGLRAEGGPLDRRLDVLQARALHATGLSLEARRMLEAHTHAARRDPDGWAALGVVLADTGDLPGAIGALERARKLAPKDAAILNNLGYAQLAAGNAEKAVALLQRSLVIDPAQARTRNNLGFAFARLERDAEALQAFRAAGSEADARYNLGVACVNRGDRADALTQFNAALEASPGHPAAAAALARLLQEAP
jgi:Flp pilus assembly protein TadD